MSIFPPIYGVYTLLFFTHFVPSVSSFPPPLVSLLLLFVFLVGNAYFTFSLLYCLSAVYRRPINLPLSLYYLAVCQQIRLCIVQPLKSFYYLAVCRQYLLGWSGLTSPQPYRAVCRRVTS